MSNEGTWRDKHPALLHSGEKRPLLRAGEIIKWKKLNETMEFYPNKLGKKRGKGPWRGELGKLVTHEKLKPSLPPRQHIG